MRAMLVALPLRLEALSYLPPHGEAPRLGFRVAVPFRRGVRVGLVVGEEEAYESHPLRVAIGYLDDEPFLDEAGISRLWRAAEFLLAPVGQVVADFLPFIEAPLDHRVRLVPGARPEGVSPELAARLGEWRPAGDYPEEVLEGLRQGGVLWERVSERVLTRRVLVPRKRPDGGLGPRAEEALKVLWRLGEAESQADLARRAGVGTGAVRSLLRRGYVELEEREVEPEPPPVEPAELAPRELPGDPGRVHGGRFLERLAVLKGLEARGPLLVLFPEGAMLERARPYFPKALAFYGEVSPRLRRRLWRERGRTVLGTHQALFFPGDFHRVVVVEEVAEGHKLRSGSHAHLPALAEALGLEPVYLGAAPSAHAVFHAGEERGKPLLLPPPPVRGLVLDRGRERGPLSGRAWALMGQTLERGHQVLVLSARKGYASRLHCAACGFEPACPRCALPLRYHRRGRGGELVCHQCGHREEAPPTCPRCGSDLLKARGPGLDWLAERLARGFPGYPVARLSAEGELDVGELSSGRPGVLVATTRVLRRAPLPGLALVVIPWLEGFLPEFDFAAGEKLFSLLWRLRDLVPGRNPFFLVEAYNPDHPALRSFFQGEIEGFARAELSLRRALGYPPVARMVKLELSHRREPVVREAAGRLGEALLSRARGGEVLGPAPAPIPRVKGVYVWHLIVKAEEERVRELLGHLPDPSPARLRLDPDPVGFAGLLD